MYNKMSLFSSPITIIVCILLTYYYINAARHLTRLHRVSYSPILTILSETIRGVDTIRMAKVEEETKNKIFNKLDNHYGIHLYIEGSKGWYNMSQRIFSHLFFGALIF